MTRLLAEERDAPAASAGPTGGRITVSLVCPFFNEAAIIDYTIRHLLQQLESLDADWELIVVNDGSTDGSEVIAQSIPSPRLRVLGYPHNRGRGHALRTGIAAASGDIVVTTEIDLSWGDRIVHELVDALRRDPTLDIVVASPHLPDGGYRNVPARRVWISKIGNLVIRTLMMNAVTMNTGMTRAYRRTLIQSLPLTEDGKEFHLEVILKASAFGVRIGEIPAILEWKEHRRAGQVVQRKSSSRMRRLIVSHSLFSLFAHPVRYVMGAAMVTLALGLFFLGWAVVAMMLGEVAAYMALLGTSLVILSLGFFLMAIIMQQGWLIQRELWMVQRMLSGDRALRRSLELQPRGDGANGLPEN